ncbi:MAG: HAD hydrolase-like protein [Anaerolineales bacterium]
MIRNIIWDAGGTLFDTYPAKVGAFRQALQDLGQTVGAERILRLTLQSTAHAIQSLAEEAGVSAEDFESRFREYYRAVPSAAQPPFEGVRAICDYICKTGGGNYIVTHRARASLEGLLQAHDMAHFFVDAYTKESPYPRKPDPASLNAMLEAHDLERDFTLAVGDRRIDILAAQAAGLRSCYYGDPRKDVPATFKVDDYRELEELLRTENGEFI